MLFLSKYIKYYEGGQIGVSQHTNFHQIETNDMEWLMYDGFCIGFQGPERGPRYENILIAVKQLKFMRT